MAPEHAAARVSILIAARDAAATLPAALQSVAAQSFRDWECVIVDDGSQDATADAVAAMAQRDPRFRLSSLPQPVGVVAARNRGLAACRGEYIALLDADDLMHEERLARQVEALGGNPQWCGVGCHVRYFPREAMGDGRRAYEEWLNSFHDDREIARARFLEMPLGHPTLLLRTEVLRAFGWQDHGWPEDWDLLLRLFAAGHRLGVVPEVLHEWRLQARSLSQRSPAYRQQAFTRCRAAFLAAGPLAASPAFDLVGYGVTGKALRKALHAHGKACHRIYEVHPRRLGQVIDGAEVLHRDRIALGGRSLPLLISVAGRQARVELRAFLAKRSLAEGQDFWLVA